MSTSVKNNQKNGATKSAPNAKATVAEPAAIKKQDKVKLSLEERIQKVE